MKRTIHIPEELARQMEKYLKEHPGETWSGLVQEGVKQVIPRRQKDLSKVMDLVGILDGTDAPNNLSIQEDEYH
jgi:hypothetical protein